jgi:membrane-bound metal-dependent hydrolase YbcI (DUF457 family)
MTFASTHLFGSWVAGKIFFYNKKISNYTWFFLLLGSILPDADFLIDWIIKTNLHKTFTHSFFFMVIASLFLYLILKLAKDPLSKQFSLALGVGILTHLLLDMLFHHGVPLLWPSLIHFSYQYIGTPIAELSSTFDYSISTLKSHLKLAIFDMGLGTAWIFYLLLRKRIKF